MNEYRSHQNNGKRYYTLLVKGESSSRKTNILDAFVYYITNMNLENKWRYKLVNENNIKN